MVGKKKVKMSLQKNKSQISCCGKCNGHGRGEFVSVGRHTPKQSKSSKTSLRSTCSILKIHSHFTLFSILYLFIFDCLKKWVPCPPPPNFQRKTNVLGRCAILESFLQDLAHGSIFLEVQVPQLDKIPLVF